MCVCVWGGESGRDREGHFKVNLISTSFIPPHAYTHFTSKHMLSEK